MLLLIAGCSRCEPDPTPPTTTCVEPAQDPAWDGADPDGRPWRAVTLDGAVALIFGPVGPWAWDAGLPVVVVAPGAFLAAEEVEPHGTLPTTVGAVEVRVLYPGQRVEGASAGGALDAGGPASANAVAAAARFAAGTARSLDGLSLADAVGHPICGHPVLLASSSGLAPAVAALSETEALVKGLVAYESPTLPAFAALEYGAVWLDPDPDVDADADGVSWDDGRDLDFDVETCGADGCAPPPSGWRWDADASLSRIMPALVGAEAPAGALYRDRDGDGALSTDGGHPDVDGSGAIDADEDWVPGALPGPDGLLYYSPDLLEVAGALLDPWPEGFATADEALAFWADRTALGAPLHETLLTALAFGARDHASALPDRPHLTLLGQDWLDQGATVYVNATPEIAACVAGIEVAEGSGESLAVTADPIALALPEDLPRNTVGALAALSLLAHTYGSFDACDE